MADWRDPLAARIGRRLARVIGWTVGAIIIAALLYSYGGFRASQTAERCVEMPARPEWGRPLALAAARQALLCMERNSGAERVLDRAARDIIRALPSTPCRYVGTWAAFRPGTLYEITLRDDSSFTANPALDSGAASGGTPLTGAWGVVGDRMVWLYDGRRTWPPDINPIRDTTELGFTLVEVNGSTTRFVLVKRPPEPVCSP